jgi:hypothetical protein
MTKWIDKTQNLLSGEIYPMLGDAAALIPFTNSTIISDIRLSGVKLAQTLCKK